MYAKSSNVNEPGRNRVKHKSYNGCLLGIPVKKFPKKAAETNVPRIPPLGIKREICIPNRDDPTSANDAPAVG